MKTISATLQAFLLGNTTFNRADLITISLPNGQVINALSGANLTQVTCPSGLAANVTIAGTQYPWLPTDPNYPFPASSGGAAASIPLSQGQVITLSYASGTVGFGSDTYDTSGGFGSPNSTFPGTYISVPGTPPIFGLIGGFANASGYLVSPPFYIGNNQTIGPAPFGATKLVLGCNDNTYSTNIGSWIINIVPPTFYSTQLGTWERGAYSNSASFKLSAGSTELIGYIPSNILYPGTTTPLIRSLKALTTSKVIIQTLFWALGSSVSTGVAMGTMQLTIGQIGNIKSVSGSKVTCELFDLTYILNRPFPPHLIQSACRHSFCDAGCTLIINNFTTTPYALDATSSSLYLNFTIPARGNTTAYKYGNLIVVSNVLYMCTIEGTSAGSPPSFSNSRGALTTDGSVTWTSAGSIVAGTLSANQSFPLGYVVGMTGQNTGFKMAIKLQTSASGLPQFQLMKSLLFPVVAGDTFKLIMGCDKTLATCKNIYNNLIHIGAMPFVPNPEIAQ